MVGVGTESPSWMERNVWEAVRVREVGCGLGRSQSQQCLTGLVCPSAGEGAAAGGHQRVLRALHGDEGGGHSQGKRGKLGQVVKGSPGRADPGFRGPGALRLRGVFPASPHRTKRS